MKKILFLLLMISFFSCEQKEPEFIHKYDGTYLFTTKVHSYVGSITNDSVILFEGKVKENTDKVLEITYGPKLMEHSSGTSYAPVYCEGIIYPTCDENGKLSYPEYLKKDLHYYFSGSVSDTGTIKILIGFGALGGGYSNEISGVKQ